MLLRRCLQVLYGVFLLLLLAAPVFAQSKQYVLTNNDPDGPNSTSIFTATSTSLSYLKSVATGGSTTGLTGDGGEQTVLIVKDGPDQCLFVADDADVASWIVPSLTKVGNFSATGYTGLRTMAATGNHLFVVFGDQGTIGSFTINPGCSLSFSPGVVGGGQIVGMAITPDGRTLVAGLGTALEYDSYAIASDGTLSLKTYIFTDTGFPHGVDITKDGKYAIIAFVPNSAPPSTNVIVVAINPDSTLGAATLFSTRLGFGEEAYWVRLSPDERFIFVSDFSGQITTLNFSENPVNVTYSGCITNLKQAGRIKVTPQGMATQSTTGAGGALYVAEGQNSYVGMLAIDPTTGCTTEVANSPYKISNKQGLASLTAYPPRPF